MDYNCTTVVCMLFCNNMKMLFILWTILSGVARAAEEIHMSGYEGSEVNVPCPYKEGFESNEKYLCKDPCGNSDVLITTTEAKKNRYSIQEDKQKRVFTVTISHLSPTDAGKYWCGVTRSGKDIYTEVKLEVVPEWCCVKSSKLSGIAGRPVTIQCPYPPQHRENRKFLCKGDRRNNCTDMVTSQSRFTLQDDVSSSSFLVMITELKAGDAGTYWCGSDSQWSVGNYTKIQLSVVLPQQTSTVTPTITAEPVGSQSTQIPDITHINMVIFIVPAVLLILAFALVIVYKCKVKGMHVSPGPEVNINRKTAEAMCEIEEVDKSDMGSSKRESVYENIIMTDNIYCNL